MPDFENVTVSVYALIYSDVNTISDFLKQFHDRPEFELHLVPITVSSAWTALQDCIRKSDNDDDDLIIVCNERHLFTEDYDWDVFLQNIIKAQQMGCDILLSGATGFRYAVRVANNIFWIDKFKQDEFFVIYKKAFQKILKSHKEGLPVTTCLSDLVSNIICTVPFMSSYSADSNSNPDIEMISKHHHESYNIAQES